MYSHFRLFIEIFFSLKQLINPFDDEIIPFSHTQQCIVVPQNMHAGRNDFADVAASILVDVEASF